MFVQHETKFSTTGIQSRLSIGAGRRLLSTPKEEIMFKSVMKFIVLAILALALILPGTAFAATNFATGDISGVPGSLTQAPTITINAQQLALVKRAFYNGTWLADNATLPTGSKVQFLIYVDNKTAITVADINMEDTLVGFTYVDIASGGMLKIDNSVGSCAGATCSQGDEEAIYTAITTTGTDQTEDPDGDFVSVAGATISAGAATAGNAQLDIDPTAVWAIIFEATLN